MKRILIIVGIFICLFFVLCRNDTLNKGLVVHYTFDSNLDDFSGNKNNAVKKGNFTFTKDRWGEENGAILFGNRSYIEVENSESIESIKTAISTNVWVSVKSKYLGFVPIYCKSDDKNKGCDYGFLIRDYNGGWDPYTSKTMKTPFPFNAWTMFTLINDKTSYRLYQNGEVILEDKRDEKDFKIKSSDMPILIGADPPVRWEYLNGAMDDFRIYNRTLSEKEIQKLYTSGSPKKK